MSLKIVFFGTPEFAKYSLEKLYCSNHQIVGVVTTPDKNVGRGRIPKPSDVKTFAKSVDLIVLEPKNLKDTKYLSELKALRADIFVVVAFRMLPKEVWQMPRLGTINLHASLLPNYRGAAPIHWCIINGEKETGVTTFFINDKIDTGKILLQEKIKIDERETLGSLYNKLKFLGANILLKTLDRVGNKSILAREQIVDKEIKLAPKLNSKCCRVNWKNTSENIDSFVRGLNPIPGAWTQLNTSKGQQRLKIYEVQGSCIEKKLNFGSTFIQNNKLYVGCKNGLVELKKVKLEGKNEMNVSDLLNGLQSKEEIFFT